MNDEEDTEDFVDLFEINESNIDMTMLNKMKLSYEPIHLPSSIIEILKIWSSYEDIKSLNRVGICPCDYNSLNKMFIHQWGESHVEQPSRLISTIEHLHNYFWIKHQSRWKSIKGRMINDEEIKLAHSEKFLKEFLSFERGESVDDILSMRTLSYANATYNLKSVAPIIADACRTAAGTTLNLISAIVRREIDFGFALIRPAGHHSSTDKVGTFCGFNSISIGARYAVEILGLDRVFIIDWDVHRSGGTEQILGQMSNEDQKKYRLIDIYAAFGKNLNANCVPSNCQLIDMSHKDQIPGDNEYIQMFEKEILPNLIEYCPSLILISAGYDAAKGELEECARITPNGYYQMTNKLKQLKIPLVFILEGGYQLNSLIQSIEATFKALLDL